MSVYGPDVHEFFSIFLNPFILSPQSSVKVHTKISYLPCRKELTILNWSPVSFNNWLLIVEIPCQELISILHSFYLPLSCLCKLIIILSSYLCFKHSISVALHKADVSSSLSFKLILLWTFLTSTIFSWDTEARSTLSPQHVGTSRFLHS